VGIDSATRHGGSKKKESFPLTQELKGRRGGGCGGAKSREVSRRYIEPMNTAKELGDEKRSGDWTAKNEGRLM